MLKTTRIKPSSAASDAEERSPGDVDPKPPVGEPPRPARRTKTILARKDGRQLRRMTVYLPPDLARRLAIYAAGADMDVSGALTEIVASFLEGKKP